MHLSWRRPVSGFCSAALSHTKNGGSGSGTGGMCGRQKTAGCAVCDCHRRVRTVREPARQSDSARNRSDARCYRRNSRHCYAARMWAIKGEICAGTVGFAYREESGTCAVFYRNRSQCGITDTRIATHDGFIRTFGDVDGSCGRIFLYGTFFRTVSPAPRLCDRRRNDQQSRARNAFTEMCGSAAVPVFRRLFRRAIVPDSPALFFVSVPKRERRCPHVTPAFDAKMLICDRRFLFECSCSDKPFHIAEPA